MRTNDGCKGCSADVRVTRGQIARMLASMEGKDFVFVSEEAYMARLDTCRACLSLAYETTCMHCGCLVEVRGKLAEKDCPHPDGTKWSISGITTE
ncbi:hypothetical protein FHS18_000080 [Paenibacillus phyllosphaerae]|uniref:Uncharacterized protein n=1 Tax=Paenibacillus phyllosphaerae TaxID=274593 RepID=A0A7W5ASW7_9BACL|nr:hypothetical protein [Paenibacillus phyllosphaerae]MBB3108052.1 hypothetical protein [Paenibacillus phyllosphaerae]